MPRLFPLVVLCFAAFAPAAPPATRPVEESRRPDLVKEHADLPKLEAMPVRRLLGIDVDNGFLRVRPFPVDADGAFGISVTDFPGFARLQQHRGGTFVHFTNVILSENDTVESHTNVILRPDHVQLNRDTETPTGMKSVTLMQSREPSNPGDESVSLLVQDNSKSEARANRPNLRVTAATFADLVRDQPALVRRELGPILRDLGASGVLRGSDPARAWQVLGPLTPPDAELAKRIDRLIARLDSDDFADRAKAEDDLLATGIAGAAELRRRDLRTLPPDPRAAAENALRRAEPLTAEKAAELGRSVPFLLDTLTLGDARLSAAAMQQLVKVTGRPIELPDGVTDAERDRRIDAYLAAMTPTTKATTSPAAMPVSSDEVP